MIQLRLLIPALACAALLTSAAPAQAQYTPPPPPPPGQPGPYAQPPAAPYGQPPPSQIIQRTGWLIGFSFGMGTLSMSDVDDTFGGGGGSFHFGGMIRDRLALMFELWGSVHVVEQGFGQDVTYTQMNVGVAGQYWASPKLWLKAGLGSADLVLHIDGNEAASVEGVSFLLGIGYELVHKRSFAVDVQARLTGATYDVADDDDGQTNTITLGVGFTWF